MISNFVAVLKKYVDFSGRASRREYWLFVLANAIIALVIGIIAGIATGGAAVNIAAGGSGAGLAGGAVVVLVISSIYSLGIVLPGLAVAVRRLHDIGKSGVWYFITFVPFIGSIWLLVLLATKGATAANEYGEPVE